MQLTEVFIKFEINVITFTVINILLSLTILLSDFSKKKSLSRSKITISVIYNNNELRN